MSSSASPALRTSRVSTAKKVAALCSVASYPVLAPSVEVIETHFAWVFLVGEHAYKMKKPAAYPLLDLRSLEDRHRNCQDEVRLNRRLAPDVYLGAVPLAIDSQGRLKVNGEGAAVDWLVWMKRLPSERMLDRAIVSKSANPAVLAEIGALLARFYERQQRYFMPADYYVRQLIERTGREGIALLAPELRLDAGRVRSAVDAVESALQALQSELGPRAIQGRVVECHGDLRPEHICLTPPCVIDSLEFSRELRVLDPAEELAFLCLECAVAGAPDVADRIVTAYQNASGDHFARCLLDVYQGRRALVRAKILAWHTLDPTVASVAPWPAKAHEYIALAERYAALATSPPH
jgi:aminoglycoside phosphotransferase family enzyme